MTPLLGFIVLIFVAYIGSLLFKSSRITSLWFKSIHYSGAVYLIVGYLLGPNILKILNNEILARIDIILGFVLGWAGFLVGLQLNFKQLKRFRLLYYRFTLLSFLLSFILVGIAIGLGSMILAIKITCSELLTVSTAAAVSSAILFGVLKKDYGVRGSLIHLCQFTSAFDNIIGIVLFGLIMLITKIFRTIDGDSNYYLILFSIGLVALLAWFFYLIFKDLQTAGQFLLAIFGFLLIVVGLARYFDQSAIFLAFIFGAVLTNLPVNTWNLYQSTANIERPAFLLLVVFVGASVSRLNVLILGAAFAFLAVRIVLKFVGTALACYSIKLQRQSKFKAGFVLIGMGGLPLAVILDYYITYGTQNVKQLFTVIVLAFLVNELFSVGLVKTPFSESGRYE